MNKLISPTDLRNQIGPILNLVWNSQQPTPDQYTQIAQIIGCDNISIQFSNELTSKWKYSRGRDAIQITSIKITIATKDKSAPKTETKTEAPPSLPVLPRRPATKTSSAKTETEIKSEAVLVTTATARTRKPKAKTTPLPSLSATASATPTGETITTSQAQAFQLSFL